MEHGAARFEVDETRQRAGSGELFVLEPESVHTGMAAVPEGWAYKVLYLEPDLLHEWTERDAAVPRAARWVVFRDRALQGSLLRAHDALATRTGWRSTRRCWPRWPRCARTCARGRPTRSAGGPSTRPSAARGPTSPSAGTERVSLAELSRVAGLSRFELVRRFRAQTGLTPHAFQTNLRIQRARALLTAGEPAAAVAAECGFADQPHLTRTFKRAVGVTPAPLRGLLTARTFKTHRAGGAAPLRAWA